MLPIGLTILLTGAEKWLQITYFGNLRIML